MQTSLTQLQGYMAMFKMLDSYSKEIHSEYVLGLLGDMCFLPDGITADPAIWKDWIEEAIENKKILTKQEAFNGMIRFLEIYRNQISPTDTILLTDEMRLAKDCNDLEIPIVKKWNFYLKEAVSEPEGTREYLSFGDPMENITLLQGFNTVYKFLDYCYNKKKSNSLVCMANNMLFLPEGYNNVDPKSWEDWEKVTNIKLTSTKQEVFDNTIKFLEKYGDRISSLEAKLMAKELRSAKNCDDTAIPLVDLWNYCLVESLNEPGGAREYLKPTTE